MKDTMNKPEDSNTDAEVTLPAAACWATGPVDKYGNVSCKKCGEVQSPDFRACIKCCDHEELVLVEKYNNGWTFDFECKICGKNFDFLYDFVSKNYRIIRHSPNVEGQGRA